MSPVRFPKQLFNAKAAESGIALTAALLIVSFFSVSASADTIEFLTGAKVEGKVTGKTDTVVEVEVTYSGRTSQRKYPLDKIHAVQIGEKRYVLNEKTDGTATATATPTTVAARPTTSTQPAASPSVMSTAAGGKTKAEIQALIDEVGRTPPDWFASTPLNYPQSLDLTWPDIKLQGWNNQKNMGQYIWDIINTNPSKWHEGVRLMHHLLDVNKGKPQTVQKVMVEIGKMYCNLLSDYPRAAFWWQKAGLDSGSGYPGATVHLAECYFRMGSKQMAVDLLSRAQGDYSMIKLWADMGETQKAIKLAEDWANAGGVAWVCYMHAGDGCRTAGNLPLATQYYQKVLSLPASSAKNPQVLNKVQTRARESLEGIQLAQGIDLNRVADGTYSSNAQGYEDQVYVAVTVVNHRLEAVKVTQHKEKQFYSSLTETPKRIIEKQGIRGVDATSGATLTSEAVINAAAKALGSAVK